MLCFSVLMKVLLRKRRFNKQEQELLLWSSSLKQSVHIFSQLFSLCPQFMNILTGSFSVCVCWAGKEHLQQDLWRFSDEESLRVGLGQRLLLRVRDATGEREFVLFKQNITLMFEVSVVPLLLQRMAAEPGGCRWYPLPEARGHRLPAAAVITGQRVVRIHLDRISICEGKTSSDNNQSQTQGLLATNLLSGEK